MNSEFPSDWVNILMLFESGNLKPIDAGIMHRLANQEGVREIARDMKTSHVTIIRHIRKIKKAYHDMSFVL